MAFIGEIGYHTKSERPEIVDVCYIIGLIYGISGDQ